MLKLYFVRNLTYFQDGIKSVFLNGIARFILIFYFLRSAHWEVVHFLFYRIWTTVRRHSSQSDEIMVIVFPSRVSLTFVWTDVKITRRRLKARNLQLSLKVLLIGQCYCFRKFISCPLFLQFIDLSLFWN